jgi:hypothetical protein
MHDWADEMAPEERDRVIDRIASAVVQRGLEAPAVLFLELHKPLTFIASQGIVVMSPFVAPLIGFENVRAASKLLEDRGNIDRLTARIEELAEEARARRTQGRSKEPDHAARER